MEELTALTKETLARVEKLAHKNKENVSKSQQKHSSSPIKIETPRSTRNTPILKIMPNSGPVSILKRKILQDDHKPDSTTPPVTFSPNVIEPATTNRMIGILKKRRSLDESQVMRHRSCSPDVAKTVDSKSILKNQRRGSLEELRRIQSPELHLHGILKRKTSKVEEDDSLNSPQSILKRKSGASSAGSTISSPHVSITTAVILAAAGGAEMVLQSDSVKPILKKKSLSEEHPSGENSETPKPILKKKSSTETDECEERPKKPILKLVRNSSERDSLEEAIDPVRPILRPRLSFCGEGETPTPVKMRTSRRSHTICAEFTTQDGEFSTEHNRDMRKPRPLSVSELVMNFENSGAIPKRTGAKRATDRYRTQPVTCNEFEASLNFVKSPNLDVDTSKSPSADDSGNCLFDFTTSLENDTQLNCVLSLHNISPDSGACGKMSSDSAFQSLGDGLELDQEDERNLDDIGIKKLETNKLELQMKAIAEEAQKMKLNKGNAGMQRYRNHKLASSERSSTTRFSTQPVTFDEVQEASKINKITDESEDKDDADPSNLSLFERIKLFNKVKENPLEKRDSPRHRINRFQTQPITSDEVETARCISPSARDIDNSSKNRSDNHPHLSPAWNYTGAVLKKFNSSACSLDGQAAPKSDIADVTHDEGISCNDSASDSESASVSATSSMKSPEVFINRTPLRRIEVRGIDGTETSDGESSGGREVRKIFQSENKLKVKQKLESVLSKSKSQHSFSGDENRYVVSRKKEISSCIRKSQTQAAMPRAIEELQAKLQQSGETGWRKRLQQNNNSNDELRLLTMNRYNEELSERSILEKRKDELDAASKQWKHRVEKSDAEMFSVAGRMEKNKEDVNLPINIPMVETKRIPQAKRFKGKDGNDSLSTPVSPEKNVHIELTRSYSVPDPNASSGLDTTLSSPPRTVQVSRPDDDTFKSFYKEIESKVVSESIDVSLDDFDSLTRQSLLVQKKNVQIIQRRRGASRNPIKALATRSDISNEYTEILTGVAEREKKRLNIEKLAKNSNFAHVALAGLVSKEDFKSINLKKSTHISSFTPYKSIMLLHIKGRQHVQTRLVEPTANSINEGDCFILLTPTTIYTYIGKYSNVIEQSRASDIVNHIQSTGDMGVGENVQVIHMEASNNRNRGFLENLQVEKGNEMDFSGGGNLEEDGIYEGNILGTNMIYKLEGDELVPFEKYWGRVPKIEMLEVNKVIVFDFGSEMYIWSGKNALPEKKKLAFRLAKELWETGYDYSDCNVNPLNVASILGKRTSVSFVKKSEDRPEWALFAKITQHRETILFKEKFLDWPDFSRVIKVRDDPSIKQSDRRHDIKPIDVSTIIKTNDNQVDLVVENLHLGRGDNYFDDETKRLFEFETLKLSVWNVFENNAEPLPADSIGQFYNSDSYIVKWNYRTTVKGRELSGRPSKHHQAGRDRCIYFCWQGSKASINEKGSAALLTIELDHEKAPQVRVVQNLEPAVFLKIFNGDMIIHDGKRDYRDIARHRLFVIRGELEDETYLIELNCEKKQLRSRGCFLLIESNQDESNLTLWIGSKISSQKKKVSRSLVKRLARKKLDELGLGDDIQVSEVCEGDETEEFWNIVGCQSDDDDDYVSLKDLDLDYDFTMRVFHFSSVAKSFTANEVLCPHRSEFSSPFPIMHQELYSASQPALFLIDNKHELWLWQGWWPEREEEENEPNTDQTGSGAVRWQAERRAAMQTALSYWQRKHKHTGDSPIPAYLVWAGLEPPEFRNLFIDWQTHEDIAQLNMRIGKMPNAKESLTEQLKQLSRTTYSLNELLHRPLPDGVDPTHLEIYLSNPDFEELLGMNKEEFANLPSWKRASLKKQKGLF